MAFEFEGDKPKQIRVVLKADKCVQIGKDEYNEYLESFSDGKGKEEFLELNGEPTRFVLSTSLKWDRKKALEKENIKVTGGKNLDVSSFYVKDLIRASLIRIDNPEGIPAEKRLRFVRDQDDGLISKDFMDKLEQSGQLGFLGKALLSATKGSTEDKNEKN